VTERNDWREGFHPDDVEVKVAELLVATADDSDHLIDAAVPEVLRLLRERMNMDVVFVAEFTNGERVFRYVEQPAGASLIPVGASDPLEETWCQRVVDGRLPGLIPDGAVVQASGQAPVAPFPIGTHLSAPIVLGDGQIYGTLCCFSFGVQEHVTVRDLRKLQYTAQLAAQKIQNARAGRSPRTS
jgi:GAF domain-containing protein